MTKRARVSVILAAVVVVVTSAASAVLIGRAANNAASPAASKQQHEARLGTVWAQAAQNPPAPKTAGAPTEPTTCSLDTPPAGILSSQGGPGSSGEFQPNNEWSAPESGSTSSWYRVWAGETGIDANPAYSPAVVVVIRVASTDGCSVSQTDVGTFTDSSADGPFTITGANGIWLSLQTTTSAIYYFDVDSHRFTQTPPSS